MIIIIGYDVCWRVLILNVPEVTWSLPKSLVADLTLVGPLPRMLELVLDHVDLESEPFAADPALVLSMIEMGCCIVSVPAEQVAVLLVATIELAAVPNLRGWLILKLLEAWALVFHLLCLIWALAYSKLRRPNFKQSLFLNSNSSRKISVFRNFSFFFLGAIVKRKTEDTLSNAGLLKVLKLSWSLIGLRALVFVNGRVSSPYFEAEGSAGLLFLGAFCRLAWMLSKALLGRFCHLVQFGFWLLNSLLSMSKELNFETYFSILFEFWSRVTTNG